MEERMPLPGAAPVPQPATPPRTWEEVFPRRPKPEGVPYGFLSEHGNPRPSTRERLLHLAETRAVPSLVWTPETAEMVPPWEVDFLVEVMRRHTVEAAARERRMLVGGWAALVLVVALFSPATAAIVAVLGGGLGLVVVGMINRRIAQARQMRAEEFRREFDAVVAGGTEAALPVPATRRIAGSLIMVGVFQLFMMDASVEAGAVSRQAVAAGEWWRLFTAPMLHGNLLHFWMNYGALESLARTMETRGVRAYVPLVFVAAALAGGVASVLLPPEGNSVGASGGLMGMFGFLGVMAWRRKDHLPEGFPRALVINLAVIGLMGVIAYRFIDNAAHAGGLLAGVLVGLAAIPRGEVAWVQGPALARAGVVAQGVIFASAMVAIALTLRLGLG